MARKTSEFRNLGQKMDNFRKAGWELVEAWEKAEDLAEGPLAMGMYPFKKSFDEVCHDIQVWYEHYQNASYILKDDKSKGYEIKQTKSKYPNYWGI